MRVIRKALISFEEESVIPHSARNRNRVSDNSEKPIINHLILCLQKYSLALGPVKGFCPLKISHNAYSPKFFGDFYVSFLESN